MAAGATIYKISALSLDILQTFTLTKAIYLGGMIMHQNGHAYCIHDNMVYAFWNGDLDNVTIKELPTKLNGRVTQTNGGILTSDGLIAVKQWNLVADDIMFFMYLLPSLRKLYLLLLFISVLIPWYINRQKSFTKKLLYITSGFIVGMFLVMSICTVIMINLGRYF